MASRKKVLVRTLDDRIHPGYLPLSGLLIAEHALSIDLLDLTARLNPIPLSEIRTIAYVRDFNLGDPHNPENLLRRTFQARPRTEGLWLRIVFASGEILEGLAPIDVSLLDTLLTDRGLFLIPPDTRGNTQRIFVPRMAIASLQTLAVITTPSKARTPQPERAPDLQLNLPDIP